MDGAGGDLFPGSGLTFDQDWRIGFSNVPNKVNGVLKGRRATYQVADGHPAHPALLCGEGLFLEQDCLQGLRAECPRFSAFRKEGDRREGGNRTRRESVSAGEIRLGK
jgi:hypothetical protein